MARLTMITGLKRPRVKRTHILPNRTYRRFWGKSRSYIDNSQGGRIPTLVLRWTGSVDIVTYAFHSRQTGRWEVVDSRVTSYHLYTTVGRVGIRLIGGESSTPPNTSPKVLVVQPTTSTFHERLSSRR